MKLLEQAIRDTETLLHALKDAQAEARHRSIEAQAFRVMAEVRRKVPDVRFRFGVLYTHRPEVNSVVAERGPVQDPAWISWPVWDRTEEGNQALITSILEELQ